jgi:hypothetical protein
MNHLDFAPLYLTYRGRGKAPHPPDFMLAMVFFALRRGQRKPSQWHRDTRENSALWCLGFGIEPSRSSWYAFRDRTGAHTCHACPLRAQCTTSTQSGRSVQRSEHDDLIQAHRAWMETAEAKTGYRLRGQTIEIVFADVKELTFRTLFCHSDVL